MAWADRTPEERLTADVLRLREALGAVVAQLKDMHVGSALHVAESSLAQNHVSDIINNDRRES